MSLGFFKSCVLSLTLVGTLGVLSSPARGQAGVSQTCATELGFKPGSRGHTDCVNQNSGVGGNKAAPKPANPAPAAKAPVVPVITAEQREDKFWEGAVTLGSQEVFEAYLKQYPSGQYATLAKAYLSRAKAVNAPIVDTQTLVRSAGAVFKDCPDCPEMVVIPAGSFEMGGAASDELPVHRVTLKSFSMGKTEVTQGQWRAMTKRFSRRLPIALQSGAVL